MKPSTCAPNERQATEAMDERFGEREPSAECAIAHPAPARNAARECPIDLEYFDGRCQSVRLGPQRGRCGCGILDQRRVHLHHCVELRNGTIDLLDPRVRSTMHEQCPRRRLNTMFAPIWPDASSSLHCAYRIGTQSHRRATRFASRYPIARGPRRALHLVPSARSTARPTLSWPQRNPLRCR
ncbi:hypothetical protein AWB74_03361 [Caballeronia arvi]|uniref:Uncharacterized protein n=1 Tax=Caballeronia arvi TaxID=1777135 RepID=A0A158J3G1_9BURK|nr:hypothetical protein AWB74_03361 [Caballeronia arvi]